jgi:hypothetical protein
MAMTQPNVLHGSFVRMTVIVGWNGLLYNENFKQVWNRPIPNGAIAIAHTHAANDIQEPSLKDASTAKKIKLPIYMISRGGIWKVTFEGIINRIDGYNWHKKVKAMLKMNPQTIIN